MGTDLNVDSMISEYIGKTVHDKVKITYYQPGGTHTLDELKRQLRKDEIVLGALECAKRNGYTGEV